MLAADERCVDPLCAARACLRRASFVCERVSALVALTCSSEIQ